LLDKGICPGGPAFLTSPCHAWILPEGDEQQEPQAVAHGTNVGPTKGGHKRRTKGGSHSQDNLDRGPPSNVRCPTYDECTQPHYKAGTEADKAGALPAHMEQYPRNSSPNHTSASTAPAPYCYRGNPVTAIPLAGQDCPMYPERKAPKTNPQGMICTDCGPTAQPQFNQSRGNKFSYQRGTE
jgi:hypothetical protein